ncbi:MAG: DUF2282 domain-containing protein [Alphaproteobacteria bacterium]|nr:DUF2282 domain-containing protein [Alphaproteobacteria bacterium]
MKTSLIVTTAIAAAFALPLIAQAEPAADAKNEKCYGVAKAGKNDCQTATSSCAGTSRRDAQADAYIYVPAGTCDRIVGASLSPRKA